MAALPGAVYAARLIAAGISPATACEAAFAQTLTDDPDIISTGFQGAWGPQGLGSEHCTSLMETPVPLGTILALDNAKTCECGVRVLTSPSLAAFLASRWASSRSR